MSPRRYIRTCSLLILLVMLALLSACAAPPATPPPASAGEQPAPTTAPEPIQVPEPAAEEPAAAEPTAAPAEGGEPVQEPQPTPTVEKPGEPAPAETPTEEVYYIVIPDETETPELPEFPWPPPQPSTMAVVPLRLLADRDAQSTLSDIDVALSDALDATGYYEKAYFTAPGGFALVTRLEQIEADGRPKPSPERWSVNPGPLKRFTLAAYLEALFSARAGHYRVIAFIVTDVPITEKSAPVSRAMAEAWLNEGSDVLAAPVAEQPLPERAKVTALIYQFRQPGQGEQAVQLTQDALPAREHLERARLWSLLAR